MTAPPLRCQYVSGSPWGPTQCVLALDHDGRHAFSPSEALVDDDGYDGGEDDSGRDVGES